MHKLAIAEPDWHAGALMWHVQKCPHCKSDHHVGTADEGENGKTYRCSHTGKKYELLTHSDEQQKPPARARTQEHVKPMSSKAQWDREIVALMNRGMTKKEALRSLSTSNPQLHRAMLDEARTQAYATRRTRG